MKKLLNGFFRGLAIAFFLSDNGNASCTIELDTLRHEKFIELNNALIDCIKDLSVLFRKYNSVLEPLKEIEKYPMFFNIPERVFPKAHIHLKPNLESCILVENIAKITNFCDSLYYNLSEIYCDLFIVLRLMNNSVVTNFPIPPPDLVEDFPEFFPEEILRIELIDSPKQVGYPYGLCEFKSFIDKLENSEDFLNQVREFEMAINNSPNKTSTVRRFIKEFYDLYLHYQSPIQIKNEVQEFYTTFLRTNELLLDGILIGQEILPQIIPGLKSVYKEKLSRSDLFWQFFKNDGEKKSCIIPDIVPLLTSIKIGLHLNHIDQAMELFAYIANLQFMIPPIGKYYSLDFWEEVVDQINYSSPYTIDYTPQISKKWVFNDDPGTYAATDEYALLQIFAEFHL